MSVLQQNVLRVCSRAACAAPERLYSTAACVVPCGVWPTAGCAAPKRVCLNGTVLHLCTSSLYMRCCAAPGRAHLHKPELHLFVWFCAAVHDVYKRFCAALYLEMWSSGVFFGYGLFRKRFVCFDCFGKKVRNTETNRWEGGGVQPIEWSAHKSVRLLQYIPFIAVT